MLKYVGGVVALLSLAAVPAIAADMPVKAPRVMAVDTWTGCYVGANIGAARQRTSYFDPVGIVDDGSHHATGVVGGGQIGCDYQVSNWVFGVQGMLDGADLDGSHVSGAVLNESKVDWFASLTGRLGLAFTPRTLIYVKGGAAWVKDKFTSTFPAGVQSFSHTNSGYTVGGGVEWKVMPKWSVFAEYNYYDFGTDRVTPGGLVGVEDIKQTMSAVLVGVNYRW